MDEALSAGAENKNIRLQHKSVEYSGGTISYSIFGSLHPEKQRILVIPGFSEDSVTMYGFAEALAEGGRRQVIVADQPDIKAIKGLRIPIIDQHAEADLAIIQAEGLEQEPLAVIAHSLGAPIEVRMAELAKKRGITALDANRGSKSVFLAPAGANRHERLLLSRDSIAKRFILDFLPRDSKETKRYDPTKAGYKRATVNLIKNPLKTAAEVWYLSKKESTYKKLGSVGLRPHVIVFPDDLLQPQSLNQRVTEAFTSGGEELSLASWSSAANLEVMKTPKEDEDDWLDDYRHAGHNDHARHPERVAETVLKTLDEYWNSEARLKDLQRAAQRHQTETVKR